MCGGGLGLWWLGGVGPRLSSVGVGSSRACSWLCVRARAVCAVGQGVLREPWRENTGEFCSTDCTLCAWPHGAAQPFELRRPTTLE